MPEESTASRSRRAKDAPAGTLASRSPAWPGLCRLDRLPVVAACVILTAVTVPYLPPGVCFGDGGDLQLASITLGIMHPPGYAGYVTLGFLATRLPGVDPAYAVSLACLASGIVALLLCILVQVRLGVSPWAAGAFVLLLAAHDRVWINLVAPEVYAPSLLFLVAAVYLLIKYARLQARSDLFAAAILFGVALANRPTVVWMLPFFLIAWWVAERRSRRLRRRSTGRIVCATLLAVLPGLYSLAYLWVRDTPETPYNYIEQKRMELNVFPDARDGWKAKLERVYWHATAREFERFIGNTARGVRTRLRWLYHEFFLYRVVDLAGIPLTVGTTTFVIVAPILVLGAALVWMRCRAAFWLLIGLLIGNVAFICTYRQYGQPADLLPLMFGVTVLGGVAVSPLFPNGSTRRRQAPALVLMAVACVVTFFDAPRRGSRASADAMPFLADLDMQTLPANAVIVSSWRYSTALWYAGNVLTARRDIEIVNTTPQRWREEIEARADRPVFVVTSTFDADEFTVTPYRNVWRVQRAAGATTAPAGSEP